MELPPATQAYLSLANRLLLPWVIVPAIADVLLQAIRKSSAQDREIVAANYRRAM